MMMIGKGILRWKDSWMG